MPAPHYAARQILHLFGRMKFLNRVYIDLIGTYTQEEATPNGFQKLRV